MSSKKDGEKTKKGDIMENKGGGGGGGGAEKTNESKPDQGMKIPKIQNRLSNEQFKLKNNIEENDITCSSSLAKLSLTMVSNGAESLHNNVATTESLLATMAKDHPGHESSNISAESSTFANSLCTKSQVSNTKYKSAASTSSNSSMSTNGTHMHLNVSSNQPKTHANSSSVPEMKLNEDSDMRNNVDYVSGIEKCPPKVSCSSESSPDMDYTWTSSSYRSKCSLNNISGCIGSTSQGTCCFLRPNINGSREAVAGPSGTQRASQRELGRRDSSSGNEGDLSDGEDYCIYTYKGNNDVLPIDQKLPVNQEQVNDRGQANGPQSDRSSPEMDFLEMDFDPGPSCEQDTGDSDLASINEDIQNIAMDNVDADSELLNDLSSGKVVSRQAAVASATPAAHYSQSAPQNVSSQETPSTSKSENALPSPKGVCKPSCSTSWLPGNNNGKWEASSLYRNTGCPLRESYGYHNTSGDLISPGDTRDTDTELWTDTSTVSTSENSSFNSRKVNLSSTLYHRMMAKKLMLNKQAAFNQSDESNLEIELNNERLEGFPPLEKVMLWSEQEATVKQVTQIATSACGATSAINALLALDVPFSLEVLVRGVATRLREPGAPLPKYLMSRSLAGSTHRDLARGMSLATNGAVVTRFFSFYPERKVSLSHWLHYWISKGAAPIATLNLQHCGEGRNIPDAWHHQMIFGVGQAGIYFTNPLQCLPEKLVWHQLASPSVLLIRRADVLAHWNPNTDLTHLMRLGQRWRKLNVLGQVVNMLRESMGQRQQQSSNALTNSISHIRIPASYEAGITLVMRSESAAAAELLHAEDLPLL